MVEAIGDPVAVGLSDVAQALPFGQVLPDQPIHVLVAAALPGVVRRCEVAAHRVRPFDELVVMELGAVVEGDGAEPAQVLADGLLDGHGNLFLVACTELLDDHVASLALHQREHAVPAICSHDGVALPMPTPASPSCTRWALADVALAWQHTA